MHAGGPGDRRGEIASVPRRIPLLMGLQRLILMGVTASSIGIPGVIQEEARKCLDLVRSDCGVDAERHGT